MEMTLGKRIGMLRRQKGLKQDELAEKLGISPQAVSKWENDQTCPDISLLPKLAQILGGKRRCTSVGRAGAACAGGTDPPRGPEEKYQRYDAAGGHRFYQWG